MCTNITECQYCADIEDTGWDVEQNRSEVAEAETFDDQASKCVHRLYIAMERELSPLKRQQSR